MRLGKRSARIRPGGRRQLIRRVHLPLAGACALAAAAYAPGAQAQRAAPATAGPARIVCNASFCELGSGAQPEQRIRVIISNLPQDEIRRLRKCTGVAKPCIVTVEGTELGDQMKIMATRIQWQD